MITTTTARKTFFKKRAQVIPREHAKAAMFAPENITLFLMGLVGYGILAYYIVLGLGVQFNDTVARSALGYFVFYSRDPHLASIGFVWTPLISALQIPFFPITSLFGHVEFAGSVVTVLFGAATLPVLNQTGKMLKIHASIRWPIVILFGIHPAIALYAAIGMSETAFFFFMALTFYGLLQWVYFGKENSSPVLVGVSVAAAFWLRYEAIPLLAGVCGFIVIACYSQRQGNFRQFLRRAEGVLLVVIMPTVYSLFLWIVANWLIMGDPLFFWSGVYTNTSYTDQFRNSQNALTQSVFTAITYSFERLIDQSVFLPGLVLLGLGLSISKKSLLPLATFVIPLALFAFHVYLVFKGQSFGWLRFYSYIIPATVPTLFWLLTFLPKKWGWHAIVSGILAIGMVATIFTTINAMSNPAVGKEEYTFVNAINSNGKAPQDEYRTYASARKVSSYIEQNHLQGLIMVDTYLGFPIVLFSSHPQQFVITQDQDFKTILADPVKNSVRWVLVPANKADRPANDMILNKYPSFLYGGPNWTKLVQDFGEWQLFQVVAADPNVEQSGS